MRIRLIRKLADAIDGIDISDHAVGEVIDLDADEARLLIAEEWAVSVKPTRGREIRRSTTPLELAEAADSTRRNPVNHLRRASQQIDRRRIQLPYGRRREDVLLDELHDSRARTIRSTEDDSPY
jgi:hypothetical protein